MSTGSFGAGLRTRVAVLLFLALTTAVATTVLLWPRGHTEQAADQTIRISMAGFSRPVITARAGRSLRLQLVNPDSPFHTDGGGWHQLAVPALGVDSVCHHAASGWWSSRPQRRASTSSTATFAAEGGPTRPCAASYASSRERAEPRQTAPQVPA
ncbi:MAG: hypothetical protein C4289_12040 [Chloroflexota bacterium]